MIRKDRTGMVLDVQRNFGLSCGAEPVQVFAQHAASDYATRVIPRMQAIAEREHFPKVMPIVIEMWKDRYGV
jgi:hypothetical protein